MKTQNSVWVLGHQISSAYSTGDYDLVIIDTPSKTSGPPPHIHQKFTEFFLVLEGEVEFLLNDEIKILGEGASVNIPPGSTHTYSNRSDKPCKMVNIHSPKGFGEFFRKSGIPADSSEAKAQSVSPESIKHVIDLSAQFDIEFQR